MGIFRGPAEWGAWLTNAVAGRCGGVQSHILQRCRQQPRPGHIRRSRVFNPGQQRSNRSRGLTAALGSEVFYKCDRQRYHMWAEVFGEVVGSISRVWKFPNTCGEPSEKEFWKFLPWFSVELVSSIYFLYHGSGSRIKVKSTTPLMLFISVIKKSAPRWLEFIVVIQPRDVSIKTQMWGWVKSEAGVSLQMQQGVYYLMQEWCCLRVMYHLILDFKMFTMAQICWNNHALENLQ